MDTSHIIVFIRSTVSRNPSLFTMRYGPCKYYQERMRGKERPSAYLMC